MCPGAGLRFVICRTRESQLLLRSSTNPKGALEHAGWIANRIRGPSRTGSVLHIQARYADAFG